MKVLNVTVYQTATQIVIVGDPEDEEDSHNCDAMGCGREHVLYRLKIEDVLASKKRVLDRMAARGLDLRPYQKD